MLKVHRTPIQKQHVYFVFSRKAFFKVVGVPSNFFPRSNCFFVIFIFFFLKLKLLVFFFVLLFLAYPSGSVIMGRHYSCLRVGRPQDSSAKVLHFTRKPQVAPKAQLEPLLAVKLALPADRGLLSSPAAIVLSTFS